ncbi:type I secretion system, ATP-binding protein [Escherichia coli]|nr:type I secretion system, ATP-binding protein [Escherichia coli]
MEPHQRRGLVHQHKQRFLTGLLLTWTQEVQSIVYVVVLLVGCFMVMNGDMTTGALVGTTILASRTIAPLSQISGVLSRWQQAKVARNGLDELMKRPVDQPEHGKLVHKAVLHVIISSATRCFITTKKRRLPM